MAKQWATMLTELTASTARLGTEALMFHSLRRKSVLESGKIRFDGTKRHSLYLRIQDYAPAPRGRGLRSLLRAFDLKVITRPHRG